MCLSNSGFDDTPIGQEAYKKCENGEDGYISRECKSDGKSAIWMNEIRHCSKTSYVYLVGVVFGAFILGGIIFVGIYILYNKLGGKRKRISRENDRLMGIKPIKV